MAYERKLIEGRFPCQQVGAETKRERGASSALPPHFFLHVWWARRPLTPSRAAVLGSILPADTDPDAFLMDLGIVKKQAIIGEQRWTLVGKNQELITQRDGKEILPYSEAMAKALDKEQTRRENVRITLNRLIAADPSYSDNALVVRWLKENEAFSSNALESRFFDVVTVPADPAHINERIAFKDDPHVKRIIGENFSISPEDMYGYGRAYETPVFTRFDNITVLDPTAGGGSIPFEALRLGCNVIANDLNPVASIIEEATLKYPTQYGERLLDDIKECGCALVDSVTKKVEPFYPRIDDESVCDYLYCRIVTCPYCHNDAPLLNAFALSKKTDGWAVRLEPYSSGDGKKRVRYVPYRLKGGKGPNGENPEEGTVKMGVGICVHCHQTITSAEIKAQATGASPNGTWRDELYCIAAVRYTPKRDKDGNVVTYTSGADKGKPRLVKEAFFRAPVKADYEALDAAKRELDANWDRWEAMDLIPTEKIPEGHKTAEPLRVGVKRWCDMFTPRQLLGHLTAMETLRDMIPGILQKHSHQRGKAIITYLQFMIDKCLDYNSRQTLWHAKRGVLAHTFTRHDYSHKWTFGEMVLTGDNSGIEWARDQVVESYVSVCKLLTNKNIPTILNSSAANLDLEGSSVDVICMDPPYYNNVQYAELSDFFYVWQKRILADLYPDIFNRRLTNKQDEAVANPVRDGSAENADRSYEARMKEIFNECSRVLKNNGIMTVMFTHKSQEAWETLTRALIESGWIITSSMPVESEDSQGIHHKDIAAAVSSVFLACRKRDTSSDKVSIWSGFGGTGVAHDVRAAVLQGLRDFESLRLNAVDEMVAAYGCALKVLSENWPVMDGDEMVSPITAMREASTVVAQYQMTRISKGRFGIADLSSEAGIAVTLFGIYGLEPLPFDDALSLSKSLNIRLEGKAGGYVFETGMIGINDERGTRNRDKDVQGFFAPLVRKGSKLRLALPQERHPKRIEHPQTEWDIMQGVILAFREGDIPVARAYVQRHADGREQMIMDLIKVWAEGCGREKLQKEATRILYGLK